MKKIIIVGAGGHAAELRDYINHYNKVNVEDQLDVEGFLDDDEHNHKHYEFSEPYLGGIDSFRIREDIKYLMGIANLEFRKSIIQKIEKGGGEFISLIHPTAIISPSSLIGKGVVISHNASVGPKVSIGDYNILNSRCTIGHDSKLGNFNFISPQVAISGNTTIGDENMIGTNACTIPGTTIGNRSKIAAGMVVYKPVSNDETVLFRHKERLTIRNG